MDEETRLVRTQVTSALAGKGTAAIAPVGIDELTTKVVAALDVIAALIPDLRTPHPRTAKKVRGGRTVPREAVVSIVAMVESSVPLQEMNLLNTERAHEVLEFDDGFRVLDEQLERLRAQVRYTVEARWAEIASDAMDAYHMAKHIAKEERHAGLAPHIATIRRHLGRTNDAKAKRRKAPPE
ncbi:MAG TPA: hypothetical protein VFP80_06350 [Thermoanaerobaculia bacterium]|nr:hypothetical protein [Thermoanaerobaculia bacterium]